MSSFSIPRLEIEEFKRTPSNLSDTIGSLGSMTPRVLVQLLADTSREERFRRRYTLDLNSAPKEAYSRTLTLTGIVDQSGKPKDVSNAIRNATPYEEDEVLRRTPYWMSFRENSPKATKLYFNKKLRHSQSVSHISAERRSSIMGFTESLRNKLFQTFTQADDPNSATAGSFFRKGLRGTGLISNVSILEEFPQRNPFSRAKSCDPHGRHRELSYSQRYEIKKTLQRQGYARNYARQTESVKTRLELVKLDTTMINEALCSSYTPRSPSAERRNSFDSRDQKYGTGSILADASTFSTLGDSRNLSRFSTISEIGSYSERHMRARSVDASIDKATKKFLKVWERLATTHTENFDSYLKQNKRDLKETNRVMCDTLTPRERLTKSFCHILANGESFLFPEKRSQSLLNASPSVSMFSNGFQENSRASDYPINEEVENEADISVDHSRKVESSVYSSFAKSQQSSKYNSKRISRENTLNEAGSSQTVDRRAPFGDHPLKTNFSSARNPKEALNHARRNLRNMKNPKTRGREAHPGRSMGSSKALNRVSLKQAFLNRAQNVKEKDDVRELREALKKKEEEIENLRTTKKKEEEPAPASIDNRKIEKLENQFSELRESHLELMNLFKEEKKSWMAEKQILLEKLESDNKQKQGSQQTARLMFDKCCRERERDALSRSV